MDIDKIEKFYSTPNGKVFGEIISKNLSNIQNGWFNENHQKKDNYLAIGFPFKIKNIKLLFPVFTSNQTILRTNLNNRKKNISFIHSSKWPVASDFVDRMLIIHELEFISEKEKFFLEVNRSLASSGQIVIFVSNKNGFWSRDKNTPLGNGTSFSKRQLKKLLLKTGFKVKKINYCLYYPPFFKFLSKETKLLIEKKGNVFWKWLGGVLIVEATKMMYAKPNISINLAKEQRKKFNISKPVRIFPKVKNKLILRS